MCVEWNFESPVHAELARKVCNRVWEAFDEQYEYEIEGGYANDSMNTLDELKERLLKVLPYSPKEK